MSYPGNPSLAPEVQKRVLTTYAQTLQLVSQGRDQEALTGCEFVLRLDPQFQPAKTLQQRLQSSQRPVVVDDLPQPRPKQPSQQPTQPRPQQPAAPGPTDTVRLSPEAIASQLPQAPQVPQAADTVQLTPGAGPQGGDTIRMSAVGPGIPGPQGGDTIRMESVGDLAPLDDSVELGALDDFETASATPSGPPSIEATPVGETVVELADEPSLELVDEPLELAEEGASDLGGDDDFLALQQQSLSLDQEHDDPLSEIDGDVPDLDSLDLDDDEDLPDLDDEPLSLDDEPLDLGGDEPLDLGGDEPLDLGGDEPLDLGGESLDLGAEESIGLAPEAAGSAGGDEEGQERIDQLLAEGQEVFDRGDYQGSIDVWSRIFLIDVTHGEASRRIEEARKKKAELERQAEEHFHEAVAFIEQQSLDEAKAALGRVLEIDPTHSLAREYLQQLEAGQVPAVKSRGTDLLDSDMGSGELLAAGTPEAGASLEAAVRRDRVVVVKKTDKRLILAGIAVALLIVVGGGWLILNKDKLFPNSQTESVQPRRVDPIARATALHDEGKTEDALAVLRKVPVADPAYQDALALIDQWEAQEVEEAVDTGPPPELLARREKILEAARRAHEARRFIRARRYFDSAATILALEAADQALLDDCEKQLLPLADAIEKYEQREYAQILPKLWLQLDEEPDNHDVLLLIVDSYYNLALTDLQRGDPGSAAEKLADALDADPENEELTRLHLFAESYSSRPPDLLYAIFVKYLPSR